MTPSMALSIDSQGRVQSPVFADAELRRVEFVAEKGSVELHFFQLDHKGEILKRIST
jgi:hypothetical protein